jgi:hypothetical protein
VSGGSLLRPFLLFSGARCRGYSLPLQRKITDFAAEVAFGKVNERLKEHYGIEVSSNGVREIALRHAALLQEKQEKELGKLAGSDSHYYFRNGWQYGADCSDKKSE